MFDNKRKAWNVLVLKISWIQLRNPAQDRSNFLFSFLWIEESVSYFTLRLFTYYFHHTLLPKSLSSFFFVPFVASSRFFIQFNFVSKIWDTWTEVERIVSYKFKLQLQISKHSPLWYQFTKKQKNFFQGIGFTHALLPP